MPVRQIPRNHMSLTGVLAHADPDTSIAFEFSLERDLQILFEFDDGVASIEEQPVRITYAGEDGRPRHYTPDLLVRFRKDDPAGRGKVPLLCEVKYRDEVKLRLAELKPRFRGTPAQGTGDSASSLNATSEARTW